MFADARFYQLSSLQKISFVFCFEKGGGAIISAGVLERNSRVSAHWNVHVCNTQYSDCQEETVECIY